MQLSSVHRFATIAVLLMLAGGCEKRGSDAPAFNQSLGSGLAPSGSASSDLGILEDQTRYTPTSFDEINIQLAGAPSPAAGASGATGGPNPGVRALLSDLTTALLEFQFEDALALFNPAQVQTLLEDSSSISDTGEQLANLMQVIGDKSGELMPEASPEMIDTVLSVVQIELVDATHAVVRPDMAKIGALALASDAASQLGGMFKSSPDGSGATAVGPVGYDGDIEALFQQSCTPCHDADNARGGLVLVNFDDAMRGGNNGPSIVAGDAAASLLWTQVNHETNPAMPFKRPKLAQEKLDRIRAWIDQGAPRTAAASTPEPAAESPADASASQAVTASPSAGGGLGLKLVRIDGNWKIELARAFTDDEAGRIDDALGSINEALANAADRIETLDKLDEQTLQSVFTQTFLPLFSQLTEIGTILRDVAGVPAAG